MYAMSHFDAPLFSEEEARTFSEELFTNKAELGTEDGSLIREHIQSLYERFIDEGKEAPHWTEPLIRFLEESPQKVKKKV